MSLGLRAARTEAAGSGWASLQRSPIGKNVYSNAICASHYKSSRVLSRPYRFVVIIIDVYVWCGTQWYMLDARSST